MPGLTVNVRMTYRAARDLVDAWLKAKADEAERLRTPAADKELSALRGGRIRIYLQRLTRFLSLLHHQKSGRSGLDPKIVDAYCRAELPDYLFICDFCSRERGTNARYDLLGELLFDATAPKFAHGDALLAQRLGRCLILNRKECVLGADNWDGPALAPENPATLG